MTWNNITTHQNDVVWKLQVHDQQEKLKTEDQVLVMKNNFLAKLENKWIEPYYIYTVIA